MKSPILKDCDCEPDVSEINKIDFRSKWNKIYLGTEMDIELECRNILMMNKDTKCKKINICINLYSWSNKLCNEVFGDASSSSLSKKCACENFGLHFFE